MKETLVLRLTDNSQATDESISWVVQREGEQLRSASGPVSEAATIAAGKRVVVLVPGSSLLLTQVSVPTQNRQRLLKAIPYMLEEQLTDDIDDLHFALGGRVEDGIAVAVVQHGAMQHWQQLLQEMNIEPDVMVPDMLALPPQESGWTLLLEASGALLRQGDQQGFAIEHDVLPVMLEAVLQEEVASAIHVIDVRDNSDSCDTWLSQLCEQHDIELHYMHASSPTITLFAAGQTNFFNLMQGDYSRRERWGRVLRPWKFSAALAAGLFFLHVVTLVTDSIVYSSTSQAMKEEIEQLYRATFPDARKVVNPRVQMEQRLAALSGGGASSGFLVMLSEIGPILKSDKQLVLKNIRYSEGRMDIDLNIGDLQALDKLKNALVSKTGLQVEIQSASSKNEKVEARMQIREGRA